MRELGCEFHTVQSLVGLCRAPVLFNIFINVLD